MSGGSKSSEGGRGWEVGRVWEVGRMTEENVPTNSSSPLSGPGRTLWDRHRQPFDLRTPSVNIKVCW